MTGPLPLPFPRSCSCSCSPAPALPSKMLATGSRAPASTGGNAQSGTSSTSSTAASPETNPAADQAQATMTMDLDRLEDGQDCSDDSDSERDDQMLDPTEQDGIIVPISQDTVERIVAGQAVSDLSGAVKELIDNALDAGASSINIKLFNQGLDCIEVSDDGSGVPKSSRPLLAMKHATSKIRQFDDLYRDTHSGQNLGFRGEALFCLANLSENLVVSTRTEKEDVGEKLEFSRNGYVRDGKTTSVARRVGTTVSVVKLFDALPVRRTDLIRRIKAQRAKLMKMMQGYGILCLGVRFNLMDVGGGTGKSAAKKLAKTDVKLRTSERSVRFEETASSVLGSKFLSGLCRTRIDLSDAVRSASEKVDSDNAAVDATLPGVFRVEGLISKAPAATSGQALARDLQFFSVNGRPVELPKISRLLGDVWRSFDSSSAARGGGSSASKKRPACVLSFFLPNNMYDVNLAPDKREVLVNEETKICDLIRDALTKLWSEQSHGTFVLNEVETMSNAKKSSAASAKKESRGDNESAVANNTGNETGEATAAANNDGRPAAAAAATSSVTPEVSSPQRQRMKRRNAFVNHFSNIGSNAPDYTYGPSEPAAVRARTPQALRPSSDVSAAERRKWDQTRLQFNKADSSSSQKDEIAKLAAMSSARSSSISTADNDSAEDDNFEPAPKRSRRKESQSNVEEPEQAPKQSASTKKRKRGGAIDRLKAFAYGATENSKESDSSEEEADEEMKEKESSNNDTNNANKSPSRVSFKPSSQDDERVFTKAIGHDHSQQQFKRHRVAMRRNSIFRTLEVSVALKDAAVVAAEDESPSEGPTPPPTDRAPPASNPMQAVQAAVQTATSSQSSGGVGGWAAAAAAVGRRRDLTVQKKHKSTAALAQSPMRNQVQEQETRPQPSSAPAPAPATKTPQKKDPPPFEPISWNHFGGTAAVVDVARATRLRMEASRRAVKESKHRRHEDGADESVQAASSVVPGDSVGITDDDQQGTSKRSKGKKEREIHNLFHKDFEEMDIIGQFNLGFILARCRNNHLWILDQHACDEKFNFERLCATTTVHEQKLIAPLPLELSPSEESCVVDNMEIFERNGFRFQYDSEKPPRHRLSLTALPHSGSGGDGHKAVQFGKEDVGALCSILGADGASSSLGFVAGSGTGADGSGQSGNNAVRRYAGGSSTGIGGPSIVRLPKAVAMFASRACRKSIMIGTPLSQKEMETVVRKMKDVNQPWDCAHGRPTMRHVRDMTDTILADERSAAQHIVGPNLAALTQADVDSDGDD